MKYPNEKPVDLLEQSLPSRERGLKFELRVRARVRGLVAPFAGAWIEISSAAACNFMQTVAPFAGAWIEIVGDRKQCIETGVAPFAGAWIEMLSVQKAIRKDSGRSLRGSVD